MTPKIDNYPHVGVATVIGSIEFDETPGRLVSPRFIEEYVRRGEQIKDQQKIIAFLFLFLIAVWFVWVAWSGP